MKNNLLRLSRIAPSLRYSANLAKRLASSRTSTREIIEEYFAAQPPNYVQELEAFEQINGLPVRKGCKTFIFVPAFNEESNLQSLVNQYSEQKDSSGPLNPDFYEVCFVVNYPEHPNSDVHRSNVERFERAIDILIEAKKDHPNIHIVSKAFRESEASLGRARKYGMDYCLRRILQEPAKTIDQTVIISNEGDTLEIPKDYIVSFAQLFSDGIPRFVQGKMEYPHEITDICEPVRLFVNCRELVHSGQGLAGAEFPYFGGIMPVGRNFAVSPRIYAQVGGIDPIRRKDTDDDMNFGNDIHVLVGERVKSISTIPLITNPRREVIIVRDIMAGRNEDTKKSYENFHENRWLYDLKYADVLAMVRDGIPSRVQNRTIQCELVNQYFQWVLISRYKSRLNTVPGFKEIITLHQDHKISYWEKELQVCAAIERHLQSISQEERFTLENTIVNEALYWFNRFVEPLGVAFSCTYNGLKSVLQ